MASTAPLKTAQDSDLPQQSKPFLEYPTGRKPRFPKEIGGRAQSQAKIAWKNLLGLTRIKSVFDIGKLASEHRSEFTDNGSNIGVDGVYPCRRRPNAIHGSRPPDIHVHLMAISHPQ